MAGVDPTDAVGVGADPVAGADRAVAVAAATRVPGGHRDAPTDLFTGTGVGAGAVAALVARQVGERAQVILAAGCHQGALLPEHNLGATTSISTDRGPMRSSTKLGQHLVRQRVRVTPARQGGAALGEDRQPRADLWPPLLRAFPIRIRYPVGTP